MDSSEFVAWSPLEIGDMVMARLTDGDEPGAYEVTDIFAVHRLSTGEVRFYYVLADEGIAGMVPLERIEARIVDGDAREVGRERSASRRTER